MAIRELIKAENENAEYDGGIVLRVEDLFAGKSFPSMLKVSSEISSYYIDVLYQRLNGLYEELRNLPPEEEDEDYQEYLSLIELSQRNQATYSQKDIVRIYNAYMSAISTYGPHEDFGKPTIFSEDGYDLSDLINDKDILNGVRARIPLLAKGPARAEIYKLISNIKGAISRINRSSYERICLAVNREFLFENMAEIQKKLRKISHEHNIDLVIDDDGSKFEENNSKSRVPYSYSASEMSKISEFKDASHVYRLYFSEFFKETFLPFDRKELWSYSDVLYANLSKNDTAKSMRKRNLTPFEAILFASTKISEFKYTGAALNDEKTRTFLPAEDTIYFEEFMKKQGKAFVCTGIASYAKSLIDEFGNGNIECTIIPIDFYYKKTNRKKYASTHHALLVKIKDEAYGLEGYYFWDPTWSNDGTLDFVLAPIEDIKRFKRLYAKIDHRQSSKVTKFLKAPRENQIGDYESVPNTLFDDYVSEQGKPIKIEIYKKALISMYSKDENFSSDPELLENVANSIINSTIHCLTSFDPETASGDFYKQMRDYYLKNISKYPDWKTNWLDYNSKIKI